MNNNGNVVFVFIITFLIIISLMVIVGGNTQNFTLIKNIPFVGGNWVVPTLWIGAVFILIALLLGGEPILFSVGISLILHYYLAPYLAKIFGFLIGGGG